VLGYVPSPIDWTPFALVSPCRLLDPSIGRCA
jgi:hypothetical protein